MEPYDARRPAMTAKRSGLAFGVAALCLALAACEDPPPRTFADFMEDPIARDGTIARCNADREATLHDIECANARRAMSAIALRDERERREVLERESERKLADLRRRLDETDRIAREAARQAALAQQEAYERLWGERGGDLPVGVDAAPPFTVASGPELDDPAAAHP